MNIVVFALIFFTVIILATIIITVHNRSGNKINEFIKLISEKKHEEIIFLIQQGTDINVKNSAGRSPLFLSVINNDEYLVKLFIGNGAKIDEKDINGDTPLIAASALGLHGIVNVLLIAKPSINFQNKKGETALFKAVKSGNIQTIKILLENGADPNIYTEYPKRTPLLGALSKAMDNDEIVHILIENGSDINASDDFGNFPVIFCSAYGLKVTLKLLIQENVDLSVRDTLGCNALLQSVITSEIDYEIIDILLNAGINVDLTNYHGHSALDIAVQKNDIKAVEILKKWQHENN